jgi:hypothetical protein
MIDENVTQKTKPVPDPGENTPETPVATDKKSDNKGAKSAVKKDTGKPAKRGR